MRTTSDYYINILVRKDSGVKKKLKDYSEKEGLTITQALEKLLNQVENGST